ncbi:MAG: APC family permease [Bryobacteraceae bacterium]|jgi:APA family basic amino acid/polyamine antiporter
MREARTGPVELKRDLGTWAASSIVVGTVIGSGIFLVPHDMVAAVGTPALVFAVWIFGGLLTLAGSLSYAELAAALPEAGGEYAYLREAYGPLWGFLYSWTQMWVAKSGSIATLATGFAIYLTAFFPALDGVVWHAPGNTGLEIRYGQLFAIALILALAWLNYYGVKLGGEVQTAITVLKVALIAAIVVVGFAFGTAHAAPRPGAPLAHWAGFSVALVAALWAYDGWNNVTMVASEIKDPQRNLPRALIGGTLAVIAIYILANAAYFRVLSAAEVGAHPRVAGEMMQRIAGARGAEAVSLAAMISIFAALNGSILSGARVPYAAARDGLFFHSLAKVNERYRTPGASIIFLSAWAAVLVLTGGYRHLFTLVIFPSWLVYGMSTASVMVLRRKQPDLPRPYRTLGYPVVPAVFVLVALAFIVSTLYNAPLESLAGVGLIALGLPFYAYWRRQADADNSKI